MKKEKEGSRIMNAIDSLLGAKRKDDSALSLGSKIPRGKYQGRTLESVIAENIDYVQFMLDKGYWSVSEGAREAINDEIALTEKAREFAAKLIREKDLDPMGELPF